MFNKAALDVVIGRFFIFCLYRPHLPGLLEINAETLDLETGTLVKALLILSESRKSKDENAINRWPATPFTQIAHYSINKHEYR